VEIASFDRGPIDGDRMLIGGYWSTYWFNGRIYGSEIARGLDVLRLQPSEFLSAAEIAAAEAVTNDVINPQTQTRIVWADTPDVAEAYLDQLARSHALEAGVETKLRARIAGWRTGAADAAVSTELARSLTASAATATGADKGRMEALAAILERQTA